MPSLGTVDILRQLVAFPTVSRDPNRPLIDWVRNFLADHGIDSRLVPNADGSKSNLFASIGPLEPGGVVLSGHTDVVPIDGQNWQSDPFTLTEKGTRLHARGACDMKGFIAAALSRVPALKAARLSRPVHFMFSYDEEIGCLGAPHMIAAARDVLPAPAAVIVGEPTNMRIANEHKGICTLRTRVTGIEAHSSLTHQGASAVMIAADLIAYLSEVARKNAADAKGRKSRFNPPYTTLSVNRIEGGTALNILAAMCEFGWDIRALPGESPSPIIELLSAFSSERLAELSREGKQCHIETTMKTDVPALHADGGLAEKLAHAAAETSAESTTVPFATEGGQFQRAGWSTVVCGPGSIEQGPQAERIHRAIRVARLRALPRSRRCATMSATPQR